MHSQILRCFLTMPNFPVQAPLSCSGLQEMHKARVLSFLPLYTTMGRDHGQTTFSIDMAIPEEWRGMIHPRVRGSLWVHVGGHLATQK